MTFTSDELTALVAAYYWPFIRVGALFAFVPVLGARSIPVTVRVLLTVALTIAIAPIIEIPDIEPLSVGGMLVTMQQAVIGLAMSFVLQLVFGTVVFGGQAIANGMGLGFAAMVDPQNGVQVPLLGQLYLIMTTLVFLALGGHLIMIELLVQSFTVLPIGIAGITREGFWELTSWASVMFAGGVLMALPVIAGILLMNMAFGVITRAAPQLNIFAVGFPVTMTFGFILVWLTLPTVLGQFEGVMHSGFEQMLLILGEGR